MQYEEYIAHLIDDISSDEEVTDDDESGIMQHGTDYESILKRIRKIAIVIRFGIKYKIIIIIFNNSNN